MKTIRFDHSSVGWTKDDDLNETFLQYQKNYIKKILLHRGYIYLNQVYEILSVAWDPNDENVCYTAENGEIDIEIESAEENVFLVKIY